MISQDLINKTKIIICTRIESKRLASKALRHVCGYRAIDHIINRIASCGIDIVLAVPFGETKHYNNVDYSQFNLRIVEGNPLSPLHRMADIIRHDNTEYIIRITHDDILIDQLELINLLIAVNNHKAGYGVSEGIVDGAGVEVISRENLLWAADNYKLNCEHVSYYVKGLGVPNKVIIRNKVRESIKRLYRLTMDYQEDASLLEAVLRELGPFASNDVICQFLDNNPHLANYNRMPLITFYTCIYNGSLYFENTFKSISDYIKFQLNNNAEYIIVDDGSTDDSLQKVIRLIDSQPDKSKIKLISNGKNQGLAYSSNLAISQSRSDYIMRIDADDTIRQDSVSIMNMINIMQNDNFAIVYPNYDIMDANGYLVERDVSGKTNHHAGGALMSKRLINEIRFRDDLKHWDSIELYKRVKEQFPVGYYPKSIFNYRKHDKNISKPSEERSDTLRDIKLQLQDSATTSSYIL